MINLKFKILFLAVAFLTLINCSTEENSEIIVEEEEEEVQLYSCVDYTKVDNSNLMSYWNIFVEDVKCSRGGPSKSTNNV